MLSVGIARTLGMDATTFNNAWHFRRSTCIILIMEITIENSWHKEGGLWQDVDLERVKASLLRYRPRVIQPAECLSNGILTLRGPRRSGKTVSLKLLVAELIEERHCRPDEVYWLNFESLRTIEQANEKLRKLAKINKSRVIFVDEVTSILNWQRLMKALKDEGLFRKATFILTGSSAHDLKKGAERMAGRRGTVENPDRVLFPMSYTDFLEQLGSLAGTSANAPVEDFLTVGGFPFRVEAYLRARKQDQEFDPWSQFQVFDDVFFYEVNRRRLDRNVAIELLGRLSQVRSNAISTESLAKPLTFSRETAKRYLDALGDSFLLASIFSYDTSKSRVAPRKNRKFLWIDPALADFAAWLGAGDPAQEADKSEMAVAAQLLRRYERRTWEGLSAPRNVFTWKSSGGNEVDFLVIDRGRKILAPYEVKYQSSVSNWDFQVMERAFGRGTLVSKNDSRTRPKGQAIPLAEFLQGKSS
ncbi:MAG: hypothetical protein C5B49_05010 [Bdellovibrio sp.]|nr:MAG: hypothetical protein C5B49_05010 [Bdellovibrio sp.]